MKLPINYFAYPGIRGNKIPITSELVGYIKKNCESLFDLSWEEVTGEITYLGKMRAQIVVNIRFQLYYFLKQNTDLKLTELGSMFNKDHSSIINGLKKHANYYEKEIDYREAYNNFVDSMSNKFIVKPADEKIRRLKNGVFVNC